MPDAIPQNLTAAHLIFALPPDDEAAETAKVRLHYDQTVARLNGQLRLVELWRARVDIVVPVEAPQSLQELVQAARQRLRKDRLRVDTDELQARKWVAQRILQEFQP
jgi:hypothetical protein